MIEWNTELRAESQIENVQKEESLKFGGRDPSYDYFIYCIPYSYVYIVY